MAGRPRKPEKKDKPVKNAGKSIVETPTIVEETKQLQFENNLPVTDALISPKPGTSKVEVGKIMEKYLEKCSEESDINLLLPKIFEIAQLCDHITEFGVRKPTSTYALLAARPKRVVSYDIGRWDFVVDEAEQICKEEGQDFEFILQNVLNADIEETDFIWSDTHHSYHQIRRELERHTPKVRKFWGFHDFETYKNVSEAWYPGVADHFGCQDGIGRAIYEFLDANKDWSIFFETSINNGLIILKRND